MVSGLINAWDVFVFPSGFRCYRTNGYKIPAEAQLFPVGHPNYKDEVAEMRKRAELWRSEHEVHQDEKSKRLRAMREFDTNSCDCPRSNQEKHNRSRRLKDKKLIKHATEELNTGVLRHTLLDE